MCIKVFAALLFLPHPVLILLASVLVWNVHWLNHVKVENYLPTWRSLRWTASQRIINIWRLRLVVFVPLFYKDPRLSMYISHVWHCWLESRSQEGLYWLLRASIQRCCSSVIVCSPNSHIQRVTAGTSLAT